MASQAAAKNLAYAGAKLNGTNPVAIFVGGTSGVGQGMAEAFNRHTKGNSHIVLVGRNRDAAEKIIENMKSVAGGSATGSYEFVQCDISLMSNVKKTAAEIVQKYPKINFLLIPAGVMGAAATRTSEGLDKTAAVHYYGRWTFIHGLLPSLRAARDAKEEAKVMPVYGPGESGGGADTMVTYNDLMCEEYGLRNPGIVFAHGAPGAVRTGILKASDSPILNAMHYILPLMRPFTVSQDECGEFLWKGLYNTTTTKGSGTIPGVYRIDSKGNDLGMAKYFGSPEERKALWKRTCEVVGVNDP
ncbi:hypothetical protein BDQ17DRAFT_1242511 [Cyathus striatus]|nr:hypothetical protein BDQ17DRAFT_1242511 [Cyathus striatus]